MVLPYLYLFSLTDLALNVHTDYGNSFIYAKRDSDTEGIDSMFLLGGSSYAITNVTKYLEHMMGDY